MSGPSSFGQAPQYGQPTQYGQAPVNNMAYPPQGVYGQPPYGQPPPTGDQGGFFGRPVGPKPPEQYGGGQPGPVNTYGQPPVPAGSGDPLAGRRNGLRPGGGGGQYDYAQNVYNAMP